MIKILQERLENYNNMRHVYFHTFLYMMPIMSLESVEVFFFKKIPGGIPKRTHKILYKYEAGVRFLNLFLGMIYIFVIMFAFCGRNSYT